MKSAQSKKLIVLVAFVAILMLTSYFLFKYLVKPSPYYPQTPPALIDSTQ